MVQGMFNLGRIVMGRHIADHRESSQGGRMKHFLQIARHATTGAMWRGMWRRAPARPEGNRRMQEYLRIARGREA